jgi:hypothetical protein
MIHKRMSEQKDAIKELESFFEKKKAEQKALRKLLEELNKNHRMKDNNDSDPKSMNNINY